MDASSYIMEVVSFAYTGLFCLYRSLLPIQVSFAYTGLFCLYRSLLPIQVSFAYTLGYECTVMHHGSIHNAGIFLETGTNDGSILLNPKPYRLMDAIACHMMQASSWK
jgi:hypothetical protein